eukprot:6093535-Prymnesium_polylepis.1
MATVEGVIEVDSSVGDVSDADDEVVEIIGTSAGAPVRRHICSPPVHPPSAMSRFGDEDSGGEAAHSQRWSYSAYQSLILQTRLAALGVACKRPRRFDEGRTVIPLVMADVPFAAAEPFGAA